MIYESHYWKDDLIRIADKLVKRLSQQRWSERSFALLEKEIMLGCFATRKLIESFKIGEDTAAMQVDATSYPLKEKPLTWRDRWDFYEFYDMESPFSKNIPLRLFCNQIIHSYIFFSSISETGKLDGIYVVSDHDRQKELFYFPISQISKVFRDIGTDYPCHHHFDISAARKNPNVKPRVFSVTK